MKGNKIVNGEKCEHHHPKVCFKYCGYGDYEEKGKHKRGCKDGDSCEWFHPELCRYSVRDGKCTKSDCTYRHLRGTRKVKSRTRSPSTASKSRSRKRDSSSSKQKSKATKIKAKPQDPPQSKSKSKQTSSHQKSNQKSGESSKSNKKDGNNSKDYFLELKRLVETLQSTQKSLQEEIATMKTSLTQVPVGLPWFNAMGSVQGPQFQPIAMTSIPRV